MPSPKKNNHTKASAKKEQKHAETKPNSEQRHQGKHADAQPHSVSFRKHDAIVIGQYADYTEEMKEQSMPPVESAVIGQWQDYPAGTVKEQSTATSPPEGLTPNELVAWAQTKPVSPLPEPEPEPDPPPTGTPTETAIVQWPVALEDTDIALTTTPTSVVVGSVFLIDDEYMTVTDISNPDNPGVTRATHGSTITPHDAGATVSIWPPAAQTATASAQSAKPGKNEPRFETKREEARREKEEEELEDN